MPHQTNYYVEQHNVHINYNDNEVGNYILRNADFWYGVRL